jgi:Ran GTPase-activating protein (RanGAP) involved in mRNA processing and transport
LALFASPHLSNLTALDLQGNFFGSAVMPALANSPVGRTLRALKLGGDSFDTIPFGVRASRWLAAGPWPPHLSVLKISFAEAMKAGGAQALADSPHLGQLSELDCYLTAFGDGGLQALAASRHLTNLRELTLFKNRIGDAGVQALTAAPWWGRLATLRLADNRITTAGVAALVNSPGLRSVRWLDLHDNRISDAGALALAASPHLRNVRKLHLYNNPMGKQAEQTLKKRFRKRVWL